MHMGGCTTKNNIFYDVHLKEVVTKQSLFGTMLFS